MAEILKMKAAAEAQVSGVEAEPEPEQETKPTKKKGKKGKKEKTEVTLRFFLYHYETRFETLYLRCSSFLGPEKETKQERKRSFSNTKSRRS